MKIDWSEHYLKKGSPNEPTYYIIRGNYYHGGGGIFCYYNSFAGRIKYALEREFIPVIDMQNFPNIYLTDELFGKENAWEYYFRQPLGIGLKTAYNGENILMSDGGYLPFPQRPHAEVMRSYDNKPAGFLAQWRMLVKLGLLKIKSEIQAEIDATYKKLFAPKDRVLGVFLRGTDYVATRPHGHSIPPPPRICDDSSCIENQRMELQQNFLGDGRQKYFNELQKIFRQFLRNHRKRLCRL